MRHSASEFARRTICTKKMFVSPPLFLAPFLLLCVVFSVCAHEWRVFEHRSGFGFRTILTHSRLSISRHDPSALICSPVTAVSLPPFVFRTLRSPTVHLSWSRLPSPLHPPPRHTSSVLAMVRKNKFTYRPLVDNNVSINSPYNDGAICRVVLKDFM